MPIGAVVEFSDSGQIKLIDDDGGVRKCMINTSYKLYIIMKMLLSVHNAAQQHKALMVHTHIYIYIII